MSARGKGPRPPDALRFVLVWTPVIRSVLRAVGVPRGDVDDCAQEVIVHAWTAANEGRLRHDQPAVVRAWVKVVASRIGARFAVRRKRFYLADMFDVAENDGDAEAPSIARDLLHELRGATTPERWRALVLHAQGWTLDEIGAAEHISPNSAKTRVRLARRDLQAAILRERAREATPVLRKRRR